MSLSPELETPTRDEELARLARALRLARGFRLYFARSLPGESRRELLNDLSRALGDVRVFDAQPGLDHLRSALELEMSEGEAPRAVCVTGIETWVPAGDAGAGSAFVRNLNAARDRFAATVPCPVVLWGADHVLRAIQHGAPDFFSVASGIYLFPNESPASMHEREEVPTLEGTARWLRELAEVDDRLQAFGPESAGTDEVDRIGLLNRKVVLLLNLAHYEEAELESQRVYEEALRTLGAEHPNTLTSANNLAGLYKLIGRFAEAEELYVSTLEASHRILGDDHPDTLRNANNLAGLYESSGRLTEASRLYTFVLEAFRRILGNDHPNTITSANNLAYLWHVTGRYDEAGALYSSTLETSRRVLGNDHPITLRSTNNLAGLYELTGRVAEAEKLYASVLDARHRVLGDAHPQTLTCAGNLANLYVSTGRYVEAEKLHASTLETSRRVLGNTHPDTLRSAVNLAYLYWVTGRTLDALALIEPLIPAARRLPVNHKIRKIIESNFKAWRKNQEPSRD